MAELGFRTLNEMVGRTDRLETSKAVDFYKAKGLDLTPIFYQPDVPPAVGRYCSQKQDHGLDKVLDNTTLLELCKPALERGEKVIIGNVAFYGATAGEAYSCGMAGERFCVRNSGVNAVVLSVGDHGCEYMTGGRVVVLGKTGRNFAAGMSGGIAYVLDEDGTMKNRCIFETVALERLDERDLQEVEEMLKRHAVYTRSARAWQLLALWQETAANFVKVMPRDYRRVLEELQRAEAKGLVGDEALMAAFEANKNDTARVSGN